jgi:hypothetical protein
MLFILGSLLLLARHPFDRGDIPPGKHALLLALAVGALSAKESWVVLPFLALAFLWLVRAMPLKKAFRHTSGLFLLLALYLIGFVGMPLLQSHSAFTAYGRIELKAVVRKAAFLVYKYVGLGEQFADGWWQLLLLAALLAALLFALIRRENRPALFGLFWMALGIGVSLPVQYAAPRYNYLPLMGFWIMIVSFAAVEYRELARRRKDDRLAIAVLLGLPLLFFIVQQAVMLHWEIEDYRLRGRMHEQVVQMYLRIRDRLPNDRPVIFIDLGKRQAVLEMAAAVKGYKKILFVRNQAIWQQVFLAPLANFAGRPFSRRMIPLEKRELLPALQGKTATLLFSDQGFALADHAGYQTKILVYYRQNGQLPFKVQVLKMETKRGNT